ncbi:hypothetical protein GV819_14110 [Pseudomonas sp. Fl5BN2]|uniref:hypothetical protein n=1 Tax=unclassified Pseudomonas TaxID=196821 RepID=UPI0013769999|nr:MULTISPECIES: hypothetical protein [unclassified Pseudomonas]NBF03424.1 hypothetical protein [Pseudomonas sp. Fl5BN2]NBF10956.1 hypothetical protein [Pseudomonas sp. Fl4BN1]
MLALFFFIFSFSIWAAIWMIVVKKRGALNLVVANLLGAIAGFVAFFFTVLLLPTLPVSSSHDTSTDSAATMTAPEPALPKIPHPDRHPSEPIRSSESL